MVEFGLIELYKPEVRTFCRDNLAGILYRCIEHPEPRWDVDSNTANLALQEYVDRENPNILTAMTTNFLVTSAYEKAREKDPNMPKLNESEIINRGLFTPELSRISGRMRYLTDHEFSNIIKNVSLEKRREYQERFLGRDVWDIFYQRLQSERSFLKGQGYGYINFN